MPVHERIKERRDALGWSQEELVTRLQPHWPKGRVINKSVLSKIENGDRAVKVEEVPVFADILGCTPNDLHDWPQTKAEG